jgi:hypothetical protein
MQEEPVLADPVRLIRWIRGAGIGTALPLAKGPLAKGGTDEGGTPGRGFRTGAAPEEGERGFREALGVGVTRYGLVITTENKKEKIAYLAAGFGITKGAVVRAIVEQLGGEHRDARVWAEAAAAAAAANDITAAPGAKAIADARASAAAGPGASAVNFHGDDQVQRVRKSLQATRVKLWAALDRVEGLRTELPEGLEKDNSIAEARADLHAQIDALYESFPKPIPGLTFTGSSGQTAPATAKDKTDARPVSEEPFSDWYSNNNDPDRRRVALALYAYWMYNYYPLVDLDTIIRKII